MSQELPAEAPRAPIEFYCPVCAEPAANPLLCGDCGSLICRTCGSPLEKIDELGIG